MRDDERLPVRTHRIVMENAEDGVSSATGGLEKLHIKKYRKEKGKERDKRGKEKKDKEKKVCLPSHVNKKEIIQFYICIGLQ